MIQAGTFWQYIGEGEGVCELHRVIFSSYAEIVTIGLDAHSFLGDPLEFERQFRFVALLQPEGGQ